MIMTKDKNFCYIFGEKFKSVGREQKINSIIFSPLMGTLLNVWHFVVMISPQSLGMCIGYGRLSLQS